MNPTPSDELSASKINLNDLFFTLFLDVSCYQCIETVDGFNRTISGDIGCFEGKDMESYLQECPEDYDHCGTEIEVDWYPKGTHQYRIIRGCSPRSLEGQDCMEYSKV